MNQSIVVFFLTVVIFFNCSKPNKNEENVKNLLILNALTSRTSTISDWKRVSVGGAAITSLIVAQDKLWATTRDGDNGYTSGGIYSSSDGKTWTKTSYSGEAIWDIKYLNSQYIAVGGTTLNGGQGVVYASTDGNTWTKKATLTQSTGLTSISGNSSFYIVAGSGGTSPYFALAVSTDLVNWTAATTTSPYFNRTGSNGAKVIITSSGAGYIGGASNGVLLRCSSSCSTTGNWSLSTIGSDLSFVSMQELNGTVVAHGAITVDNVASSGAYTSTGGAAFTRLTSFTAPTNFSGFSILDSKFVIHYLDSKTNAITFYYSSDGSTWKTKTTKALTTDTSGLTLSKMVYLNGTFFADGSSGSTYYTQSTEISFP
jgi:hypothetical protein